MSLYNDASLVMIPSAYKDGKLYSIKPTDGSGDFTFSRGSNLAATRVDENGLIEKGRENLLLQSNSFDTTWTTSDASVTGGQTGYDGSSDAWLLTATGTSNCRINQGISSSGVKTLSIYAKAGTADWVIVQIGGGTASYAWFDLSSGAVGDYGELINSEITSVDGGWYRCSITGANSNTSVNIYVATANNSVSTSSGDNIYIQDAQLEQGLVATDYIETTTTTAQAGILEDMPRLDYSGGASCPSLLLEPQRTNAMPHSEYFADLTPAASVLVENSATSPEGLQNAYLIYPSSSTSNVGAYKSSIAAGTTGVVSCFVKSAGKRYAMLGTDNTANYICVFDLQEGEVVVEPTDYTGTIESYGNGWYRITAAYVNGTALNYPFIGLSDDTSRNVVVDGTNGIYIYGMQYEINASYPTSYIPCYGAATTRSSDSCAKTGISSLIGQEQGTIFIDLSDSNYQSGSSDLWIAQIAVNDSNVACLIYFNVNTILTYINNGTSSVFLSAPFTLGQQNKIAVGYINGDYAMALNGVIVDTDSSAIAPPSGMNQFSFVKWIGIGNSQMQSVKQAALFKTRLTNGELAALTTI